MERDRRSTLRQEGGSLAGPTVRGGLPRRSLLAAPLLLAARKASAEVDPGLAALYAAAKAEGGLTWYIAHISSDEAETLGHLFTQGYPGVAVSVVRATGQVIYQKLSADMRAGARNCDVFSSTDLGQYVTLAQRGLLLPHRPAAEDSLRAPFRDHDKTNLIQVTNTNYTALAYRPPQVSAADAPRRWTDLLDPKWMGKVAVAHPGYSGAMGTWVYQMDKLYGWEFFEKLAKNKPQVGRSLIDPITTLVSGERQVGLGPSDLIIDQAARGNPVAIAFPEDGSVLTIGPTSILKDAPHPAAAKLFVEFLLGPEAGRFAAGRHRLPVTAGVQEMPGIAPPEGARIIDPRPEELVKGIPAVVEKWRDTFGV